MITMMVTWTIMMIMMRTNMILRLMKVVKVNMVTIMMTTMIVKSHSSWLIDTLGFWPTPLPPTFKNFRKLSEMLIFAGN